jgi:hypothetical protein
LIGSQPPYALARLLTRRWPTARLAVLAAQPAPRRVPEGRFELLDAGSADRIRRLITRRPAPDLLVFEGQLAAVAGGQVLVELLPLLPNGGRCVIARRTEIHESRCEEESAAEAVRRLVAVNAGSSGPKRLTNRDDVALARCIGAVDESGRRHLAMTRDGRAWVKVRDRSAARVLSGRLGPDWGRQIEERPAGQVVARARLWINESDVQHQFHQRFEIPERYLRLYRNVICTPRQLVLIGDAIAPISFHHSLARRPRNRDAVDVGQFAAMPRVPVDHAPTLAGTYYNLASEFPGHFGHFMTEDLGRLWGWDRAREQFPTYDFW